MPSCGCADRLANPVLLGRLNISQGNLTFFGNTYTINQRSVSTSTSQARPHPERRPSDGRRGVEITLTVSGPVTKLNVSYRSDPPLQFSDIVALLATGRTPNDATIAARQPTRRSRLAADEPSALVGQAIANPSRGAATLLRSQQAEDDPTISGETGNPQAKITLSNR